MWHYNTDYVTTICALSGNNAYEKTLYDAWIPEFRSGMDPDPARFRVYIGSGPDPAGTKMSRSSLDLDPVGSENCGFGAPLDNWMDNG